MKSKLNFLFLAACVFLFQENTIAQIKINEYSVSNLSSFTDNFGGYEDWIELYNSGASPVNLNGYHLGFKTSNISKWTFGNVTINPGTTLLIWASGHDMNTGPYLHTNFTLKQCQGDKIIFADPSLTILDSLTLKKTQVAHSRGRTTNGAATWSVFKIPTPGTSNNTSTSYLGYASTPVMSLPAGFYSGPQSLTISSPDPGVNIVYTTNGGSPVSSSSTPYFAAILIPTTTVIRAMATSTNTSILPSFIENNTYFINVTHSVSVVSVFGDQTGTLLAGSMIYAETGLEYFDNTGAFKTESFGQANKHGNDSWSYPQRGIDFVCHDQYGYNDALKYQMFNSKPRAEFQRIILKASANDNYPFECPVAGNPYAWGDPTLLDAAHIRDAYVHTVAQKANMHLDGRTWTPGVMYVNGKYWGVYDIREKVDDKDFTKYYYNSKDDSLQYLQTWGSTWSAYGGTQAQTDWNNFANWVAANNLTIPANYAYVDSVYSIKSLTDYVILNSYAVTSDWLNWNTAWWRGLNADCAHKKWRYTLWDEDATFHHYINYTGVPDLSSSASPCDPSSLNDPGGQGHIPILNKLLTNSTFKQYYVMRYFDLINSGLSCSRMTTILDSMINCIKPEMNGHIAKWGGSYAAWQQNVNDLKAFIMARCDSITKKFNNCYNTTGPYKIKINVDPPNSGTVDFNSLYLTTFLWQGTYPGNLPNIIKAHPKTDYCFSHWTTKTHTLSPSMNDSVVNLLLNNNDSIVAHFIYNPKPTVTPPSTVVCFGNSVQLQASNGINYNWSPVTALSCTNCPNPVANPGTTTIYTVTSIVSASLSCKASGTQTINVVINPTITTSFSYTDICAGNSVQLEASNGLNYTWIPAVGLSCVTCSNPVASPTVTTIYTITSNSAAGCKTSVTQTVNVMPYAIAGFTAAAGTSAAFPQSINITNTSSLAASYYWSLVTVGSSTATVPTFTVNSPGTYSLMLIAYNGNGCNDTVTSTIIVSDILPLEPVVIIPNVFSPNGDGVNDFFFPILSLFKESDCVIYDRWGKEIIELKTLSEKWNGETVNGKECPNGSYFYIFNGVDLNGKHYLLKGYVQLVR